MLEKLKGNIKLKVSPEPVEYIEAVKFMEDEAANVISGKSPGMIWVLEHPSLYTAGVSAKEEDLINSNNIPIYKTNRGGKYTYHGPGIKIIYFILDLKKLFAPQKPDIAKFVIILENFIIDFLQEFNIKGEIKKDRVGIWVKNDNNKEDKIAAIGIKIRKWTSYHGIAINLNPNLEFFNGIVPCGISSKEFGVTSIKKLQKSESLLSKEEIEKKLLDYININFI